MQDDFAQFLGCFRCFPKLPVYFSWQFVNILGRNIFLYDCDVFTRDGLADWGGKTGTIVTKTTRVGVRGVIDWLHLMLMLQAESHAAWGVHSPHYIFEQLQPWLGLLQGVHGLWTNFHQDWATQTCNLDSQFWQMRSVRWWKKPLTEVHTKIRYPPHIGFGSEEEIWGEVMRTGCLMFFLGLMGESRRQLEKPWDVAGILSSL